MNVKSLWRALVPVGLRETLNPAIEAVALRRQINSMRTTPPQAGPLVVSGYFSRPIGVGRAAQQTQSALRDAGLTPLLHDLDGGRPPNMPQGSLENGVWILHCNAPEAVHAVRNCPSGSGARAYRIGYWVYELPIAPRRWRQISRLFDEIWVPSQFVADAMVNYPVPVRIMPHPVPPYFLEGPVAQSLNSKAPSSVHILAAGDLRSSAARKNLVGAISIFQRAFPDASDDVHLTLKVTAPDADEMSYAKARAQIATRPDIEMIDTALPNADMEKLLQRTDIILSPHRSEGFGLLLAEGFQRGIPSLATGWSGNLDYMAGIGPLLITHNLVKVQDTAGIYRQPAARWADPDEADAAEKLRVLVADAELRARSARQGQAAVARLNQAWGRSALMQLPFNDFLSSPIT